jgi:hypothetical protein
MTKAFRNFFAVIVGVASAIALVSRAGAQNSFYPKSKEEGQVLLYTSLAGSVINAFRKAFEKAYPGVKLEIYRASGTMLLQIQAGGFQPAPTF